nr:universal stress protein [Salinarchaeum sp. Harcht-Bsk1]
MRVVVPVEVLEGETVSAGLVGLLASADITVLGYHVVPEQTTPEQMQAQFGERARDALADLTDEFQTAGGQADFRLVFTHDREQTVDRVVDEVDAEAVAITGTTGEVTRLLVSLSGDVAADRIVAFVTAVAADRPIEVTLLSATEEETADPGRIEAVADALAEAGVDVVAVTAADDPPLDALVDAVPGHDAVVVGERAPSLSSILLGDFEERVAAATVGPVLVVQRPAAEPGDEDEQEESPHSGERATDREDSGE